MPRGVKVRDDGDGSVYRDGDGWRAALIIDGKRETRRASTEREAKDKLKELAGLRRQRLDIGSGKQTLKTWCEHWLSTILPERDVKPKTLQGHRYVIERYVVPHLGKHKLVNLTAQHIDEWQAKLRAEGLASGTIVNARRRLHTALEIARKRKMVPENVVGLSDPPKPSTRRRVAGSDVLTEEQINALLLRLRQEDHRLYTLYALAATLGLRQAELMGLRWPVLDMKAGTLSVREQLQRIKGEDGKQKIHREKSTKNGKDRDLLLSPEQLALLRTHQTRQRQEKLSLGSNWRGEDLIFTSEDGTPLEAGSLYRQFKRALARAGLPAVTFHSLRHSAGSIMLANGAQLVDVSHVLGHANPSITAKIYAHSFEDGRREAVEAAVSALLRSA